MKNNMLKKCGAWLLLAVLLTFSLPFAAAAQTRPTLLLGGMPFGVRFITDGILVVGFCDVEHGGEPCNPARAAGVCAGDCIIKINEEKPASAKELAEMIEETHGNALTLTYRRGETENTVSFSPLSCDADGRYRAGLWVRDSGAGIGTVTFMVENTRAFGGLGHGICDGESGVPLPLLRGSVLGVTIGGITRGAVGAPGELRGHFSAGKTGALLSNTPCGVFGAFGELPASPAGALPVAFRNEIKNGEAVLWCTLDDNVTKGYTVRISAIDRAARGNKCFTVTVTDKDLLARTGGIVQGMSGSPLVQEGRIVGAVTHVLIGDPTTGYGVFIENMLEAMPQQLK